MTRLINLIGQRFASLVVVRREINKRGRSAWLCQCDCGRTSHVSSNALTRARVRSCGCAPRGARSHGLTSSGVYYIWKEMHRRCSDPKSVAYRKYGGRGIKVCSEWDDIRAFYRDVGPRPSTKHSLDRIDGNGNYEPGNVRWATAAQQLDNRRITVVATAFGRTQKLSEWEAQTGIPRELIYTRIKKKGWSAEEAVSIPRLAKHQRRAHLANGEAA